MFIGHFAVGLAGKKAAPQAPLAALWAAALFADLLWPVLVAVGAEEVRIVPGITAYTPLEFVSYPWSHSLLMLCIWGALFAAFYRNRRGGRRIGVVLAALVVSHWVLDWITHRPDMPLWPYGPKVGLGLWNSVPATMAVEITMLVAGVVIYSQESKAKDGIGEWGFRAVIALLLGFYIQDSISGTPPQSVKVIWVSALIATSAILAWIAWVESHREVRVR